MPTVSFGGGGSPSTGTFSGPWNVGISWVGSNVGGYPTGNINLSGGRPVAIDGITVNGSRSGGNNFLSVANVSGTAQVRINWDTSQRLNFTRYIGNQLTIIRGPGVGGTADWSNGGLQGNYVWSTVPTQPSSISTSVSGRDIRVQAGTSGSDGGASISSYTIQMSVNGGAYGSNRNTRDTTYTNLTPGSTYRFRVYANNKNGSSSAAVSGTTTIVLPPNPPSSITPIRERRSVTVTLGESSVPDSSVVISGYTIQRRESLNNGVTWGAWGDSRSTDTINRVTTYENLGSTTTQQFRGRAESNFGPGEFTTSDPIFIPGIPDPPQQVLALQQGAAVQVIVTAPTSDGGAPILTYRIEKRISENFGDTWSAWEDPVVIPGNEPVYLYESLVLQKTYQFRAFATNEEGDSESPTESNSVYLPAIVRIRDEGVFRLPSDYKRYDENIGAWIGLSTYKRYFNGQWVNLE